MPQGVGVRVPPFAPRKGSSRRSERGDEKGGKRRGIAARTRPKRERSQPAIPAEGPTSGLEAELGTQRADSDASEAPSDAQDRVPIQELSRRAPHEGAKGGTRKAASGAASEDCWRGSLESRPAAFPRRQASKGDDRSRERSQPAIPAEGPTSGLEAELGTQRADSDASEAPSDAQDRVPLQQGVGVPLVHRDPPHDMNGRRICANARKGPPSHGHHAQERGRLPENLRDHGPVGRDRPAVRRSDQDASLQGTPPGLPRRQSPRDHGPGQVPQGDPRGGHGQPPPGCRQGHPGEVRPQARGGALRRRSPRRRWPALRRANQHRGGPPGARALRRGCEHRMSQARAGRRQGGPDSGGRPPDEPPS